ncbi:MAG: AmmeMemoRadiSam system protein B [Candidatus Omnitrophica bacterium]|nr:AmmeMemoRadiSam system protein B [Candidatus Omnitrophota bacterium]
MRIKIYFLLMLAISTCFIGAYSKEIKRPEFNGSFYPSNSNELNKFIDNALNDANTPAINGEIVGILVPHAGYVYSGKVAAFAYKTVENKDFDTVVIISSAHQHYLDRAAVYSGDAFETPLGSLEIDQESLKTISTLDFCVSDKQYFSHEHPIEVQLPFIIKTAKTTKILPIILGKVSLENLKRLADTLNQISRKKRILIVASSDLSHFHPYDEAVKIDRETTELIKNKDIDYLWTSEEYEQNLACGIYPIITLLYYSNMKDAQVDILKYANSGDATGEKGSVVGYTAAVSYVPKKTKEPNLQEDKPMTEFKLNDSEKKELLKITRASLESYLKNGKIPKIAALYPILNEKRGAFVTLKEHGELRGCIGRIVADTPLYEVISAVAIESATEDPRFSPVTYKELKDIEIEISVLTPFEKVNDLGEIEVGRDGLLISKGFYSGLLLPQVPLEYGWNRETFLEHTCLKAGLPKDAYKEKGITLYRFSAIVFNEKDFSK